MDLPKINQHRSFYNSFKEDIYTTHRGDPCWKTSLKTSSLFFSVITAGALVPLLILGYTPYYYYARHKEQQLRNDCGYDPTMTSISSDEQDPLDKI